MKHLYVVTHPQATHHIDGLVGGWYDSELTALGLRQATSVARRLREFIPADSPVELYSSDLRRAAQTAEIIGQMFGVPMQTTTDLREKSYGEAEGKPQAWLEERFVYPPKLGDRLDHDEGIPVAESRRELATRIYRAMDRMLTSPCSHQIIVTHGFALTFVVAAWITMPLDAAGSIAVKATSGGITHLCEDDLFANRGILSLNDTSHLPRADEVPTFGSLPPCRLAQSRRTRRQAVPRSPTRRQPSLPRHPRRRLFPTVVRLPPAALPRASPLIRCLGPRATPRLPPPTVAGDFDRPRCRPNASCIREIVHRATAWRLRASCEP